MANTIKLKTGSGSDPSASDLIVGEIAIRTDSGKLFTKKDNGSVAEISGGGGIDDGDKGDITVSNGGDTFTIDTGAVTSGKIANGTILNADINASAAIAGTKISPNFGSQAITGTTGTFTGGTLTLGTADSSSAHINSFELMTFNIDTDNDDTNRYFAFYKNGASGSGTELFKIDESGNVTVAGTVDGRDLATDGTKLDGIESNATADQTASEILTLIKTVDGAGSGLNADVLDGISSASFLRSDVNDTCSSVISFTSEIKFGQSYSDPESGVQRDAKFGDNGIAVVGGIKTDTLNATGNITCGGTVDGVDIAARNTLFGGLTSSSGVLTNGVTATTQSAGNNTTRVATTAFVSTAINNLINGAPSALDTLNELAAAMNDNASFSTTVTNSLATKMPLAGGEFTGNITFSGSQTVDGRDLSVDGSKLDGIESGATADQTASEILTLLKTVDGAGSGLDADTLDGITSSSFLRSDANDTMSGNLTASGTFSLNGRVNIGNSLSRPAALDSDSDAHCRIGGSDVYLYVASLNASGGYKLAMQAARGSDFASFTLNLQANGGELQRGGNKVWDAGNDGSGSGLDSDLLDGQEGSYYRNASNINAGTISDARLPSSISSDITGNSATATKLATARNIAGVSFDGSANISLNNNAITNGAGYITSSNSAITNKLPLAGGTMTGELQINARLDVGNGSGNDHEIRIYKADNNNSDHIQFYNGTTRIGEIGCQDTTWLRINQITNKNIYTPRYIRADAGFFVDGTSKGINGSGNFIGGTIAGASDYGTLVRSNASDTLTGGTYTFNSSTDQKIILQGATSPYIRFQESTTNKAFVQWHSDGYLRLKNQEDGATLHIKDNFVFSPDDSTFYTIWHSGNDGSGSGLDADTLDGVQAGGFLRADTADTATADITFSGGAGAATIAANSDIRFTNGDWTGNSTKIQQHSNRLYIVGGSSGIRFREGGADRWDIDGSGHFVPKNDSTYNIGSNGTRVANGYFDTLYGDGSNLTGISAGAQDGVFWENNQTVTSNYTITNGKNAMSAGPITINSGITVTVGSGETWTVV